MADFPNSIFSPVTKVNRPGIVYVAAKTTRLFAEDTNNPNAEIVAIENELGTNPKGSAADVKTRIEDIESHIGQDLNTSATPQFARLGLGMVADETIPLTVGGRIQGGTYFDTPSLRVKLDLAGAPPATNLAAADFVFPSGGVFRVVEAAMFGAAKDIFFQAIPATTSGYGYLEAWNGAGLVVATGNAKPIIFSPNRSERMRLSSDGKLGVGITPSHFLDLSPASGPTVANFKVLAGQYGQNTYKDAEFAGNGAFFGYISGSYSDVARRYAGEFGTNGANGFLTFRPNDTEKMRITNDGNVGIRTTSPLRALDINEASGNCLRLIYNDSNGAAANYIDLLASSGGNLTITPSGGIAFITGSVDATGGFKDNGQAGIDTNFLDADGNTITVSGGIVTAITAP